MHGSAELIKKLSDRQNTQIWPLSDLTFRAIQSNPSFVSSVSSLKSVMPKQRKRYQIVFEKMASKCKMRQSWSFIHLKMTFGTIKSIPYHYSAFVPYEGSSMQNKRKKKYYQTVVPPVIEWINKHKCILIRKLKWWVIWLKIILFGCITFLK